MSAGGSSTDTTIKLYRQVVNDVISGVRETLLDDGVDQEVIEHLKQVRLKFCCALS